MAATNVSISPAKAQEIMKRADSAMAKLQKIRGKTEEKVGEVFKMAETVGGAVAIGIFRTKFGEVTVGPEIPVEALVGAGLSLTAFLDLPGKYSEHLHNVGNGILAGWGTLEAVKMGGGVVLSKEEYERLSAQVHQAQSPAKQIEIGAGQSAQHEERATGVAQLPAAQNRRSAREAFAPSEAQGQEVAANHRGES